jgi:hypothetical protein
MEGFELLKRRRSQFLLEVIGHVLMCGDSGLSLKDYRPKFHVFRIFGFLCKGALGLGVIANHLAHILLVKVFSREREHEAEKFLEGLQREEMVLMKLMQRVLTPTAA